MHFIKGVLCVITAVSNFVENIIMVPVVLIIVQMELLVLGIVPGEIKCSYIIKLSLEVHEPQCSPYYGNGLTDGAW